MPETLPKLGPLFVVVMLGLVTSIVGAWIWVILRVAFRLPVLPPRTPRFVPWGAGSVLAAVAVYFVAQVLVVSGYAGIALPRPKGPDVARPPFSPFEMMGLSAAYNLATLALVPLTLALTARARLRDFGLSAVRLRERVALGLFAYPILAPLVFGTMLVAVRIWKREPHPLERAIRDQMSPSMAIILVLASVVLAPMAEELMFRGVLLGWLTRLALKPRKPAGRDPLGEASSEAEGYGSPGEDTPIQVEDVEAPSRLSTEIVPSFIDHPSDNPYAAPSASISLISPPADVEILPDDPSGRVFALLMSNVAVSILFAAMHAPVWPTPVPIFFLSLGLGLLYQRTGGLIAPIALHMTFNGVSTLLMFLSLGIMPPKDPKAPNPVPEPAQMATVLGATANSWSTWVAGVSRYSANPGPGPEGRAESRGSRSTARPLPPRGGPTGGPGPTQESAVAPTVLGETRLLSRPR